MLEPVRMVFRNVERSPALEESVRVRVQKLRDAHGRRIHCDVFVERANGHDQPAPLCMRLHVHGARKDIAIERAGLDASGQRDAYAAVRELFDTADRMLRSVEEKSERHVQRVSRGDGSEAGRAY